MRPSSLKNFGGGDAEFVQDESGEPLEGKDLQARVAVERGVREQLAFKLKRGLFGREQNQRRAFRRGPQAGADFGQTAEGLAAAGGAEKKARLHGGIFTQRGMGAKEFISMKAAASLVFQTCIHRESGLIKHHDGSHPAIKPDERRGEVARDGSALG